MAPNPAIAPDGSESLLMCPQIIIIIYLSVVGALLLYMAFLMLVDPLIRKPDAYTQPLHNEEENEVRGLRRVIRRVMGMVGKPRGGERAGLAPGN